MTIHTHTRPNVNKNIVLIGENHLPSNNEDYVYDTSRGVEKGKTFKEMIVSTLDDIIKASIENGYDVKIYVEYNPPEQVDEDGGQLIRSSSAYIVRKKLGSEKVFIRPFDFRMRTEAAFINDYERSTPSTMITSDDLVSVRRTHVSLSFKRMFGLKETVNLSTLTSEDKEFIFDHCVLKNRSAVYFDEVVKVYRYFISGFGDRELDRVKRFFKDKFMSTLDRMLNEIEDVFFSDTAPLYFSDITESGFKMELKEDVGAFVLSFLTDLAIFFEIINPKKTNNTRVFVAGSLHVDNLRSMLEDMSYSVETVLSNDSSDDKDCYASESLMSTCSKQNITPCEDGHFYDNNVKKCVRFEDEDETSDSSSDDDSFISDISY